MSNAGTLYSRDVLALAASLSQWPLDAGFSLVGSARSPTCGSSVTVALTVGSDGRIVGFGLQAHACAIGQASAALFAKKATGCNADDLADAVVQLRDWLGQETDLPAWPGFETIAAARDYPARHGAIPLAWLAALEALSTASKRG